MRLLLTKKASLELAAMSQPARDQLTSTLVAAAHTSGREPGSTPEWMRYGDAQLPCLRVIAHGYCLVYELHKESGTLLLWDVQRLGPHAAA
jgi:hypothetical protein